MLWAYHAINPAVGAAKADIWRYCVLYVYGGLYLDDDSDIRTPLDEVVKPDDHLLMSEEGASSLGDCYIPTYHLADKAVIEKYPNLSTAPLFHGYDKDTGYPKFFHGNTLVNWGIFVRPRHPAILKTLTNVIEILRSEYLRKTVLMLTRHDVKWKLVM